MIPDKIYVLFDEDANFLSHTFTNVPCEYGGTKRDVEYIRKGSLLEWAREQEKRLLGGEQETIQIMIDKIESL